jgi:hypothetical protein
MDGVNCFEQELINGSFCCLGKFCLGFLFRGKKDPLRIIQAGLFGLIVYFQEDRTAKAQKDKNTKTHTL